MASDVIVQTLRLKDEASASLTKVSESADKTEKRMKALKIGVAAAGAALAAMAAAAGAMAKKSLEVGSQFEKAEVQLAKFTGSAADGKARMEELFEVATTKPFELGDIIQAEINLRALGVEAEKVLPMVLDFAGAMGVDVPQAAVELGRAMQFGAGAVDSVAGKALRAQVEMATGLDALAMSTEEFAAAATAVLTDTTGIFAGGADELAGTYTGLMSMMQDQWTAFAKMISDAGLFQATKQFLREMLKLMNDNKDATQELAGAFGSGMVAAMAGTIKAAGFLVDTFRLLEVLGKSILFAILKLGEGLLFVVDMATSKIQVVLGAIGKVLGVEIPDVMGTARDSLSGLSKSVADDITMLTMEIGKATIAADDIAGSILSAAGGTGGTLADVARTIETSAPTAAAEVADQDPPKVTLDTDSLEALGKTLEEADKKAAESQAALFDSLSNVISGDFGSILDRFSTQIGGAIMKMAPGLQSAMGGTAAGAAGLVGGGVVAGVQMLAQLGETGADAVADQAEAFLDAVVAGLKELPKLLTEFLPELVGTLIPELLMGIHESLPDIIWGVLKAAVLLIKAALFDLPKALILGFAELFSDWWGKIRDFFKSVFSFGGVDDQQFQAGTGHVDRTGMALVHQGESIIPKGGVAGQTTAASMGGGVSAPAVTINTNVVDPNSIPALVSEIERHFGSYGRGTSPLFSGA